MVEHVGVTWPVQQSFSRMLGPWLAASHPCRHPISARCRFTWSSHRVRCAPLRLIPNWRSLSNTFLVRHPHEMPQPLYPASLCYRQDARFAVQLSKLVVQPSPLRSMLQHRQRWSRGCVAQTCPERLHPPLGWSRTCCRKGSRGRINVRCM